MTSNTSPMFKYLFDNVKADFSDSDTYWDSTLKLYTKHSLEQRKKHMGDGSVVLNGYFNIFPFSIPKMSPSQHINMINKESAEII